MIPVHVIFRDAESIGDVGELETAVRFKQLRKCLDLHLSDIKSVVGVPVSEKHPVL